MFGLCFVVLYFVSFLVVQSEDDSLCPLDVI